MNAGLFKKCFGLPLFHTSRSHGEQINAPSLTRDVSADFFEAFASKQLAGAGNMLVGDDAVVVLNRFLTKRRSGDSQSWIFTELSQQKFEVFLVERDIGIEVADDVVAQFGQPGIARVKSMDLPFKMPFATFRHLDQLNPWVVRNITRHDFVSAVGRTIADDNPFDRTDGLREHRLYGQLDKPRLVPRRSNQREPKLPGRVRHGPAHG